MDGGDDDCSKVKPLLLDSIAKFLQSNGFSRTLNKLRSEAHLPEDGGKSLAVDLEEMRLKFMATVNGTVTSDAVKEACYPTDLEKKSKIKNKKASHSTEIQKEDESNLGTRESVLGENGILVKDDDAGKKSKDKKKRASHSTDVKVEECKEEGKNCIDDGKSFLDDRGCLIKDDDKDSDKAEVSKENKAMKKRKRHGSKDNENKPINGEAIDESGPKFVDASEDFQTEKKKLKASTNSEKSDDSDAIMKSGHDEQAQKELGHCNGVDKNAVKEGEKSASQKRTKKQHNELAGPTSAKAFLRERVEEVVFADDRLKDNSYWAKRGAETGYGAKAQEVLGQVRGRDFRHEKTKKKQGSYRGGQIDLQSHSIKFSYSDEERHQVA